MALTTFILAAPLAGSVVLALGTGLAWLRFAPDDIERGTARKLLVVWVALATAHFWFAGPYSYGMMTFDLGNAVSRVLHLINQSSGGQFAQGLAGGVDVALISSGEGSIYHFNDLLLSSLPIWLAYLLHKTLVVALGAVGIYLLARRIGGSNRVLSLLLAAFGSIASIKLTGFSFNHGLGHALVPLATYIIIFCVTERWYWPAVVTIGALWSLSGTPTHSGMGLAAALFLTWVFMGQGHRFKIALAVAILGLLVLANWHDGIWTKYLLGGLTYRGVDSAVSNLHDGPLTAFMRALRSVENPQWAFMAMGLVGVSSMFVRRAEYRFRYLGLWLSVTLIGPLMISMPWQLAGLKLLNGLSWWNTNLAGNVIYPLIVATAFGRKSPATSNVALFPSRRVMTGIVAVLLAAQLGYLSTERSIKMLSRGGIANMTTAIDTLSAARGALATDRRVVSVPVHLEPNFAAAAGLSTLDGIINPFLAIKDRYWDEAVMNGDATPWLVASVDKAFSLSKTAGPMVVDELFNLDALRAANVGYIISRVPLSEAGGDIHQVVGPENQTNLFSMPSGMVAKTLHKLANAFNPPPLRIYELVGTVERVFAARSYTTLDFDRSNFATTAMEMALKRGALLDKGTTGIAATRTLEVKGWTPGRDSLTVALNAPDGGLLVINMAHMPYWHAEIDGVASSILPANLIHMALPIPPGARQVVLSYHRPTVFEAFAARAN